MYAFDFNLQFDPKTSPAVFTKDHAAVSGWLRTALCSTASANLRIFDNNNGSSLINYLHEPVDDRTAASMRSAILSSIPSLDARIEVDPGGVLVTPKHDLPGFLVEIRGKLSFDRDQEVAARFLLTRNS